MIHGTAIAYTAFHDSRTFTTCALPFLCHVGNDKPDLSVGIVIRELRLDLRKRVRLIERLNRGTYDILMMSRHNTVNRQFARLDKTCKMSLNG